MTVLSQTFSADAEGKSEDVPLCVDLDGTVAEGDTALSSFLSYIKRYPLGIFCVAYWHLKGRAWVKHKLERRFCLEPAHLSYIQPTLDYIKNEKAKGRKIYLCTGSNIRIARKISAYLGLFDGVFGTYAKINFVGHNKADSLVAMFGEHGFDYIGNSKTDLKVWPRGRMAIVVNASSSTTDAARKIMGKNLIELGARE